MTSRRGRERVEPLKSPETSLLDQVSEMPLGAILRASALFYLHIRIARAFPVFLNPKTETPYMYQPNPGDINVSTQFKLPTYHPDRLCHILLGDYAAVVEAINRRSVLRYCQPHRLGRPHPHWAST
jgi:hypothetical protein